MKNYFTLLLLLVSTTLIRAQVKINELMASNENTVVDNVGAYSDWVELHNPSGAAIDLAGYYLTDDYSNLKKFRFTSTAGQVVVPANGYLIIWASSTVSSGANHTSFSLSADGERVALVMPDGLSIVDSLTFGPQRMDISYGRLPNGGTTFKYFTVSTPGLANVVTNSYDELLSPPVFSHAGGFYSSSFGLSISHPDPGVNIYYTTDGSVPSAGSLTPQSYTYRNNYPGNNQTKQYQSYSYTSPLTVDDASNLPNKISTIASTHSSNLDYLPTAPLYKGKVIRAVAVKAGALTSEVTSSSFFFSPTGANKFTLPVVSVMSQEDGLFSYNNGIYVPGIDFDNWRNANPTLTPDFGSPANYRRTGEPAERASHFEIIESDTVVYKQDVGIRINGGWSRGFKFKSLRLYGTDQYKTIEHPLFPQLPYDEYKTFILRNAGNDYNGTFFKDALVHETVAHLKIDIQAYRPALLFLNGEYWGIHNMRQRQDKHYYAQKYGVNGDSLDIIGEEIEEGTTTHYRSMISYINTNGVVSNTHYDYVQTQMDVESFRDYQITEIFYNNQDWGTNNIKYWRLQVPYNPAAPLGHDGRWRWSLYDADATISNWTDNRLSIASSFTNYWDAGFLLGKLLQNQAFRNDFINRFADLMNTVFTTSYLTGFIEAKRNGISAEIPAHLERWKTLSDSAAWLSKIANCITFFQQRPGYQQTHIQSKFGLSGQYNLTVNVSNPAHGYVRVNTIDILPSTPGVNASPYPWTGSYFYKSDNSIPVVLRARPKLGYKFKHWVYNATILTDSVQIITATSARSYTAVFEPTLVAATLESCGYVFKEWASSSTAGTFPANMKFVYMADTDPGLNSDVKGFTTGGYALTSGTRIRGQGANGVSFVNTGSGTVYPGMKLGGALLVLNTVGKDSVSVTWTGRTVSRGAQEYGIRLQYSIDKIEGFADVLDANNQVVEYSRGANGSSSVLKVNLPSTLLNQPYVYLLWRYYHKVGTSGNRDELGVDDIFVESKRVLSGNTAAGVSTEKDGVLFSTASVGSTSNVLYEAKRFIELNPGFNTSQGAVFQAQIKGCP
jgi:hypothetical protein